MKLIRNKKYVEKPEFEIPWEMSHGSKNNIEVDGFLYKLTYSNYPSRHSLMMETDCLQNVILLLTTYVAVCP
jgi:hypothetical protein